MSESLLSKISEIEKALENPLAEPRVEFLNIKPYTISERKLMSLQNTLRDVYDAIDRCTLKNVDNPTLEISLKAVKNNGYELLFFKKPTPEMYLEAVRQNPYLIRYIEQTPELCLEAVRKDAEYLKYVNSENQTDEVCLTAIGKSRGWAIGYIKNQKFDYCIKALDIDSNTFCRIKKEFRTKDIIMYAVLKNPYNFSEIDNPSEEIQLEAVRHDGTFIDFIRTHKGRKSRKVMLTAIEQNPEAFLYIKPKYQTPEICIAAVKQAGMLLRWVKEQTPEICKAAVDQDPRSERFVRDKSMLNN